MKYTEITEPTGGFINNTTDWILVTGISYFANLTDKDMMSGPNYDNVGVVLDLNGNPVDQYGLIWGEVVSTGNTSEPYVTFQYTSLKNWILVPPQHKFVSFGTATAFYLTFEELMQFFGIKPKQETESILCTKTRSFDND